MAAASDSAVLVVSLLLATWFRYDFGFETHSYGRLSLLLTSVVLVLSVTGRLTGLYAGWWRAGGFEEVRALGISTATTTIAAFVLNLGLGHPLPSSAALAAGPMALVAMWGSRLRQRLRRTAESGHLAAAGSSATPSTRVVVFGAGDGGNDVLGAIQRDSRHTYQPVALLDDDPAKANLRLHGVCVRGNRTNLGQVARTSSADTLLIAVPSASGALIRDLTDRAAAAKLDVLVLPSVGDLFDQVPGVRDIRPLSFNDMLGRREVELDLDSICGYLRGRAVLVTGAGGSIGSELCRQVLRYGPAELVMLDRDESALHALQLSLNGRALLDDPDLVVADIRDRERMIRVLAEFRPEVVFHAAALKHLPLLQMHPEEAVKTNVLGTLNLLDAAAAAGVRRFVNVSTDKAADPISALGYSKRITERLTSWHAALHEGHYLSVRFGNVLGSRGSVLGAFQAQAEAGTAVTVTHPEATRYFMTVEEAVGLVIQAGAVGESGNVLVLDMGEPVRIRDFAQQVIRQSGRELPISYTGLRPGEKIHEVLLAVGERDVRPAHPQISHVPVPALAPADVVDGARLHDPREVSAWLLATATAPLRLPDSASQTSGLGAP